VEPSLGAPASGREARVARAGRWIELSVVLAGALMLLVPWRPVALARGVDGSWMWALHEPAVRQLAFGSEFAFTFGPLGFLYTRTFHPSTALALLLAWVSMVGLWAVLLWRHLARTVPDGVARVALCVGLAAFGRIYIDAFFLSLSVLAVCIAATDERREGRGRGSRTWCGSVRCSASSRS
jgi:hypothetical protein